MIVPVGFPAIGLTAFQLMLPTTLVTFPVTTAGITPPARETSTGLFLSRA